MYQKRPRKETYIREKETHICEESVAFTFASTYARRMGQRLVCAKRGLEKRRIYVKKRPIYVKRVSHLYLQAHLHVIGVKSDLYFTTRRLQKRRIYLKQRPIFVKRASHSHLQAYIHVTRVFRDWRVRKETYIRGKETYMCKWNVAFVCMKTCVLRDPHLWKWYWRETQERDVYTWKRDHYLYRKFCIHMNDESCHQRPTFMKKIVKRDQGKRRMNVKRRDLYV